MEKYPSAKLSRNSVDRWIFELSEDKLNEIKFTARQKNGQIRLPGHIKAMEASRTKRPDLESEIYLKYRYRKDVLKFPINYS